MRKKAIQIVCLAIFLMVMIGCGKRQEKIEKIRDIPFRVLIEQEIPPELKEMIETQKEEGFQFTFADGENLYICIGYGKQLTGGYSISVSALYETLNAVYVHANLIGPTPEEVKKEGISYPYLVIKTENTGKSVVF